MRQLGLSQKQAIKNRPHIYDSPHSDRGGQGEKSLHVLINVKFVLFPDAD